MFKTIIFTYCIIIVQCKRPNILNRRALQYILNNTNNKNWNDTFDKAFAEIDDTDKLINETNKYKFEFTTIELSARRQMKKPTVINVPYYWRDKKTHARSDALLKKLGLQALYNARYKINDMQQLRERFSKSYQFKIGYTASKAHYHFKLLASVRHIIAGRYAATPSVQYMYHLISLNNVFYDLDVDFDWLMHFLETAFQRQLEIKAKQYSN